MNRKIKTISAVLTILLDISAIYLAYLISFWVRFHIPIPFTDDLLPQSRFHNVEHYYLVLFISHITIFYFFGIYERRWKKYFWDTFKYLFLPCLLGSLFLISVYFFKQNIYFPRSIFVILPIFTITFTNLWRNIRSKYEKHSKSRTIIAGINEDTITLIRTFLDHYSDSIEVIGVIAFSKNETDKYKDSLNHLNIPILGLSSDIKRIIKNLQFNEIILTPKDVYSDLMIDEISRGKGKNISLYAVPSAYEILLGRLKHTVVHDIPMVAIKNPNSLEIRAIKRAIDLILTVLLIFFTAPLFLIFSTLIKLTSKGAIFYKQERSGRSGKSFMIIKFRSMIHNAESYGIRMAHKNDNRITPLGKFMRATRMDELPQLFNILKGDMSFVGPRPERKEYVRAFIKKIPAYRERFRVKPGITGLAQIRGRYHTDPRIKLKYDLAYISNYSLWLDLKIMLETIKVVLTCKGT